MVRVGFVTGPLAGGPMMAQADPQIAVPAAVVMQGPVVPLTPVLADEAIVAPAARETMALVGPSMTAQVAPQIVAQAVAAMQGRVEPVIQALAETLRAARPSAAGDLDAVTLASIRPNTCLRHRFRPGRVLRLPS